MRSSWLVSVAAVATAACASPGSARSPAALRAPAGPVAPAPPSRDHPGFAVRGAASWYLIGDRLTAGEDRYQVEVRAPASVREVELWLDGRLARRAVRRRAGGPFRLDADIARLAAGRHQALLSVPGARSAFARLSFVRTYPLYVVVTTDWDEADNPDIMLGRQDELHMRHPALVITHFVGPYTFTDPSVSPARVRELVDYLTHLRSRYGDEIGLHIHPRCSFVRAAGVTCRTRPSFAYAGADPTGYTVPLTSYSRAEIAAMLRAADRLFVRHHLGKPTSFRAGGWTADRRVLAALAADRFVVDSSAANWRRMEEWKQVPGATLYQWARAHWGPIGDTSQPYYPSRTDILTAAPPRLPILEVPDNGLLVDFVTAREMIAMFRENWPGGALAEPRVYCIGYHPPDFSEAFYQRMDHALAAIDRHLASRDAGPVVYARGSDLVRVFPPPATSRAAAAAGH